MKMRKPTEPTRPPFPTDPLLEPVVQEQIGPLTENEGSFCTPPHYPVVSIPMIEAWAQKNDVHPGVVSVQMRAGSHVFEMVIEGSREISQAMRGDAYREHQAALQHYHEVTGPAYVTALEKYTADLHAYYKWKHGRKHSYT